MEPRVTKRERKLHLSYELPQRIHCAQIYPITAPNGSTVIIYGHETGLRVLWRGGKRRKIQESTSSLPSTNINGSTQADIIILDSDDDATKQTADTRAPEESLFEDEEEELDPDCPYPPIIEDLEISVGTDVLHIAVPPLNASVLALAPDVLEHSALIAISSADGALRVIQVPLEPPAADGKDAAIAEIGRSQIELSAGGPIPADVTIKLVNFAKQADTFSDSRSQPVAGALLVAAALQSLKVWQIQLVGGELVEPEKHQFRSQPLPAVPTKISFHPSARSSFLLLADVSGSVRIYDPFATTTSHGKSASGNLSVDFSTKGIKSGSWVMTFQTAFQETKDVSSAASVLARRKKVLDATWIMTGKAILTLLEDGEWGVWELRGNSQTGKKVEDFVFHGFLGTSSSTEAAETAKQRKGITKLAPMTPNTRKAKSESLFAGTPKVAGVAATGGISIISTSPRPAQVDESVVIWYNGDVYSITSMQSFWQRSANGGGNFGSLYAPGVAHVTDINLLNEEITSISQFNPKLSAGTLGQMNTFRDLLISAERRLIVLQSLRPNTPSRTLFQQAVEKPAAQGDQVMLDAGELDIGGVDRILDSMAAGDGRTRKVGFAH